jgi:hypothetical protein
MSDILSTEQITKIIISFFPLIISYHFFKIGIWYSPVQNKNIYNWPIIFVAFVFSITGLGILGMAFFDAPSNTTQ